ncbi:hypothetical protein Q3H58_002438 [Pseudomonas psychrotolerans]|nr:hypothetical protein [Pseudomonas psychrotolerans]
MVAEGVVADITLDPSGEAMHLATRQAGLQAAGGGQGAGAEDDDGRAQPFHFTPGTTTSEKYGDAMGSTSSSGTMRWLLMVARSI